MSFVADRIFFDGFTFDDVLLIPACQVYSYHKCRHCRESSPRRFHYRWST